MKSYLYKFLKCKVKGGTYTTPLNTTVVYSGLSWVKHFMFWNNNIETGNEQDSFPVPAVFLEINSAPKERIYHKTNTTNLTQIQKDKCQFTLHLVTNKLKSENKENNYIAALDYGLEIYRLLTNASTYGISNIIKIDEGFDSDSKMLIDYRIVFECLLTDATDTDLTQTANVQISVTPSAL